MSDVELPADVPGSPGSRGDYVESPVDLPTVDCCKKDCLQCLRTSPFLAQAQSRLLGNVERLGQAGRALHGAGHGAPCAHGGAAPAGPASRQRGVRCGASVAVLVRQRLRVTSAPATGELGFWGRKGNSLSGGNVLQGPGRGWSRARRARPRAEPGKKKKKNDFSSDRTLLIFDPGDRAGKIFLVGYPGSAGETSELDYGILT